MEAAQTERVTQGMKPLQPLTFGSILLVGVKKGNFDKDICDNPRVVMWESQHQHWNSKELPVNTCVLFITRWVGHSDFSHLVKEARKRNITIFNSVGTGMIARSVRELLNVKPVVEKVTPKEPSLTMFPVTVTEKMTDTPTTEVKTRTRGKLLPLAEFIDPNISAEKNAPILMEHANAQGIKTTLKSLAVFVLRVRRAGLAYAGPQKVKAVVIRPTPTTTEDVSIQILDKLIVDLKDIREYLVSTVKENRTLRTRIEKFKNFLETE